MIRIRFRGSRRKLLKTISRVSTSVNIRTIIRFRNMVRLSESQIQDHNKHESQGQVSFRIKIRIIFGVSLMIKVGV